jgi:hypothetical protein
MQLAGFRMSPLPNAIINLETKIGMPRFTSRRKNWLRVFGNFRIDQSGNCLVYLSASSIKLFCNSILIKRTVPEEDGGSFSPEWSLAFIHSVVTIPTDHSPRKCTLVTGKVVAELKTSYGVCVIPDDRIKVVVREPSAITLGGSLCEFLQHGDSTVMARRATSVPLSRLPRVLRLHRGVAAV